MPSYSAKRNRLCSRGACLIAAILFCAALGSTATWGQADGADAGAPVSRANSADKSAGSNGVLDLLAPLWGVFARNAGPTTTIEAQCTAPCADNATIVLTASATSRYSTVASVEFFAGGVSLGSKTSAPYTWTMSNVAAGGYSLSVIATDVQGKKGAPATASVTVRANAAPVVNALAASCAPAGCNAPTTVTLTATATDSDGDGVARVEFYDVSGSPTLIGQDTAAPFTLTFPREVGGYSYRAIAVDGIGKSSTLASSPAVSVTVNNLAPTVSNFSVACAGICMAAPGAPAQVTLSASASDASPGSGLTLYFYKDTGPTPVAQCVVSAGGCSAVWSASGGSYATYADAVDGYGGRSARVGPVHLNVALNHPPTIAPVSPTQTQVTLGGAVTFVVAANDPDSGDSIETLALLSGSSQLATGTLTAPGNYAVTWQPGSVGSYTNLRVRATDTRGASSQSDLLTVEVIGSPPSAVPNAKSVAPANHPTPDVGTTPGTFAVADSGAATYTIPIQVPPGTAGMQPQLALSYNSQSGYGMLGTGWSLSGLSAITRCPMNVAQDGKKAAINYDIDVTNDRYCLDGQRLIPIGTTADGGQEFRTEVESYSRIVAYAECSNAMYGPNRFRVWTKEGRILDYGSRWWILNAGWQQGTGPGGAGWSAARASVAKVWVLDQVSDRAGNYLTIDYADKYTAAGQWSDNVMPDQRGRDICPQNDSPSQPIGALPNVEYWPTSIKYYPAGGATNNEVFFTYEELPTSAQQRYYDGGAGSTTLSRRLIGIETWADGLRARKYHLRYEQGNARNFRLKELYECGATDTHCLKNSGQPYTLRFEWSDAADGFVAQPWGGPAFFNGADLSPPGTVEMVKVGDINGDGRSDLVVFKQVREGIYSGGELGEGEIERSWRPCFSNGAGFDCEPEGGAFERKIGPGVYGFPSTWYLADIDGDGRVDLVLQWYNKLELCYSHVTGWSCVVNNIVEQKHSDQNFQGDLDGDGRIDHIYYLGTEPTDPGARWAVCLSTDNGLNCAVKFLRPPCADPQNPLCQGSTGETVQHNHFAADFNGDGKLDLLLRHRAPQNNTYVEGQEEWRVCFSDFGPGGSPEFICHEGWVRGIGGLVERSVVLDFNGDGLPDMAARRPDPWLDPTNNNNVLVPGTDWQRWQVCVSAGDGAFEFFDPNIRYVGGQFLDSNDAAVDPFKAFRCRAWTGVTRDVADLQFGDFNGDGRSDLLALENGKWRVCLSTGTNFRCGDWGTALIDHSWVKSGIVTGDFDGDGRTDVLVSVPNLGLYVVSPQGRMGDQLTRITTGFGATTDITYAPLTDSTVYQRGSGANAALGEIDIQSPMYVVKKTQASNGQGGVFTEEFFYKGLRGTTQGRGLMGFETRRNRDDSGVVTEIDYQRVASNLYASQWPIVGRPREVRKYAPPYVGYKGTLGNRAQDDSNLKLVERSTTTWSLRDSRTCGFVCPAAKEVLNIQTVQARWEPNGTALPVSTTSTPLTSYDNYGNALSVVAETSDGFKKTTTNTYQNLTTDWLLGRLMTASVKAEAPGVSAQTRSSSFSYQGVAYENCGAPAGSVCSETIEPGQENSTANLWMSTRYAYDTFGNRSTSTVQFKTLDGAGYAATATRSNTTTYDTSGRYPVKITNALGQEETRQYDARWGAPTKITGPNGAHTEFAYDLLGRKYRETTYAGPANAKQRLTETFTGIYRVSAGSCQGRTAATNAVYCKFEEHSSGAATVVQYDNLQRELRSDTRAFANNVWAQAHVGYDNLGRKASLSKPAGSGTTTTSLGYDVLGRVVTETTTGGAVNLTRSTSYQGLITVVTVTGTSLSVPRITTTTVNSQGQIVRVQDALNGATTYAYDAQGNLLSVTGPTNIAESMTYDLRGRKTQLVSPDAGTWNYAYNGLGEMTRQTDAKGQVTTQFHDALGRLIERREYPGDTTTTPFVTVWSFDQYADPNSSGTCAQGIGKLCETRSATLSRGGTLGGALEIITSVTGSNHSVARSTQYDAYGRAERQVTELREPGSTAPTLRRWVSATSYDSESRPDKTTYPSGFILVNRYTAWSGALDQVSESASGQVHWKATGRHLDGQIAGMELGGTATLGSGINVSKTYDGFGRVSGITAGSGAAIQNATFTFDALGNLIGRGDAPNGQASETFGYDLLNRLTTQNGVNVASYYADGRLYSRSGITGFYGYQTGTHRVNTAGGYSLGYDNNGNVTTLSGNGANKTLTYLPFNLPSRIQAEGNTLDYRYDAAHARIKETVQIGTAISSTYYLGAFEEHARNDGVVELRHYLLTPEGAVGIVTRRSNAQNDTRYWFKDHLGSIVASTDGAGTARQRFTYDPWGKRTTAYNADASAEERGFTGHEHLTEAGLIHMNGRLYFDALGRMLQADPIIQAPYDGQNYDRYAYVFNNPLSLIDPTGYSAWTRIRAPVAAIVVTIMTAGAMTAAAMAAGASTTFATVTLSAFGIEGATLSVTGAMIAGAAGGFAAGGLSSGNIEGALQGALQGAAFGALNFGIGNITTGAGNVVGEYAKAANVALHAVVGCAQSAAAGGSCKGGAASGGFSAAAGAVGLGGGVVGRAVVGAMASKLAGGRAGDGAMVGVFDYLFNHDPHAGQCVKMGDCSEFVAQQFRDVMQGAADAVKEVYFTALDISLVAMGGVVGEAAGAGKGALTVYRVFGGDARAQGFSWTTEDPRTVGNFRDAAGLPSGGPSGATNTADFLLKGRVNAEDIIKSRSAVPLDGNRGGLREVIIDPKNVQITDFSVLRR